MKNARLKIAYLSSADPSDKRAWSGIHFNVFNVLQKYIGDATALGPWQPEKLLKKGRWYSFLLRKLTGKRFAYYHSSKVSHEYGKYFTKKLNGGKYDLIFAVAASSELAQLETDLPIYYLADATFANMVDYYPFYTNLSKRSIREGNEINRRALQKAKQIFLPSPWAINSVTADYHCPNYSSKINAIHFGANLEEIPEKKKKSVYRFQDKYKLLFVGVEWERKGGPVVVDTLNILRAKGIDASLTIVGCDPKIQNENIHIIPLLDKNNLEDRKRFNLIFEETNFFILPTKAECFGVVFCETAAFGIPSLTTDTGGIRADGITSDWQNGGVIENGVNGFLFSPSDGGKQYAAKIEELISNEEAYIELRIRCRNIFEEKLNWDAVGKRIQDCLKKDFPDLQS